MEVLSSFETALTVHVLRIGKSAKIITWCAHHSLKQYHRILICSNYSLIGDWRHSNVFNWRLMDHLWSVLGMQQTTSWCKIFHLNMYVYNLKSIQFQKLMGYPRKRLPYISIWFPFNILKCVITFLATILKAGCDQFSLVHNWVLCELKHEGPLSVWRHRKRSRTLDLNDNCYII